MNGLRNTVGLVWSTADLLRGEQSEYGWVLSPFTVLWRLVTPLDKAVWAAVSVDDPEGGVQRDKRGKVLPDPDLRDYENVPLDEDIGDYMRREVRPHVPDAWVEPTKTKIGYEIPLTRHFYVYTPPRPLEEIDADIKQFESEIQRLLKEVTE